MSATLPGLRDRMPISIKTFRYMANSIIFWVFALAVLCGCRSGSRGVEVLTPASNPTVNPAFSVPNQLTKTAAFPTATIAIPNVLEPDLSPGTTLPAAELRSSQAVLSRQTIYDETLSKDWTLEHSWAADYDDQSTITAQAGSRAIAFTPTADSGSLLFSLKSNSQQPILRDLTLGVSFWIYCDDDYIKTSDIGVSMQGSEAVPYWKPDDHSVVNVYQPVFSETRLYYLDINRDIPPGTWVQIELWLDERQYDPDYKYVTGFYIKTDQDFRNTIMIDQVELVLTTPPTSTPTP